MNDAEYGDTLEDPIPADGLYTIPPDDEIQGVFDEDFDLDEQP